MQSIIKRRDVLQAPASSEPGASASAAPAQGAPRRGHHKKVQLLRLGEVEHALERACACGEVTVIELVYPQAPEKPPTP